jgi:hypothetical protein
MDQDGGTRNTYTDADSETTEPVHPTSGAEVLRRANVATSSGAPSDEPAGAQEPPD